MLAKRGEAIRKALRETMNQTYPRRPRRWRDRPFDDLAPRDEATAWRLIAEWQTRRGGNVPQWLYPKLIERAYKLVEDPSTPYRLAGAAGGKACARRHPGKEHPIHKVRLKMLTRRRTRNEEREREKLGLPPKIRSKWLDLG